MLLFAIFFLIFLGDVIKKDAFKIVYVAPMKALAAEMTANFGKKLAPLGLRSSPFNFHLSQSCSIVRQYDETSTDHLSNDSNLERPTALYCRERPNIADWLKYLQK